MRFIFNGIARDSTGTVIPTATVTVFLAGTSTPALFYIVSSGGSPVSDVTTSADGSFFFYVDDSDYHMPQLFKITISKLGYSSATYDDVEILMPVRFMQPQADSTAALQWKDVAGNIIMSADTVNKRIGVGNTTPERTLSVNGTGIRVNLGLDTGLEILSGNVANWCGIGIGRTSVESYIGHGGFFTSTSVEDLCIKAPAAKRIVLGNEGQAMIWLDPGSGTWLTHQYTNFFNASSTETRIRIFNSATGGTNTDGLHIIAGGGSGLHGYIWNYETGDLYFGTAALQRLNLSSAGGVYVGTASVPCPEFVITGTDYSAQLLVQGTVTGVRIGNASTTAVIEGVDKTGTLGYYPLRVGGSEVNTVISGSQITSVQALGMIISTGAGAWGHNDLNIGGLSGWQDGEAHRVNFVYGDWVTCTNFTTIESAYQLSPSRAKLRIRNLFNAAPSTDILMTFTGDGYIGIGNDAPEQRLNITTGTVNTPQTKLHIGVNSGQYHTTMPTYSHADTGFINAYYGESIPLETAYERYLDIGIRGSPDGTYGGTNIRFLTHGVTIGSYPVERMRIDDGGNLGFDSLRAPTTYLYGCKGIALFDQGGYPGMSWVSDTGSGYDWVVYKNLDNLVFWRSAASHGSGGSTAFEISPTFGLIIYTPVGLNALPSSYQANADDLVIAGTGWVGMTISSTDSYGSSIFFADGTTGYDEYAGYIQYQHGDDSLHFGTSALERMVIDANGFVGIGNTVPGNYSAYAYNLVVGAATTGHTGITIVSGSTSCGSLFFGYGTTGDQAYKGFVQYDHNGGKIYLGAGGTWKLSLDNGATMAFTGNEIHFGDQSNAEYVGYINYYGYSTGTTQYRTLRVCDGKGGTVLDVSGINWQVTAGGSTAYQVSMGSTPSLTPTATAQADPRVMTLGSNYGNSTAGSNLKLVMWDSSTTAQRYGLGISNALFEIVAGSSADMGFFCSTTELMRLNSSGNLGIGVSPSTRLHVYSSSAPQVTVAYDSTYKMTIAHSGEFNIVDGSNKYLFKSNSTTQVEIDTSSNVLIGGATAESGSTKTLAIPNGTAPDNHVDNEIIIYSVDSSDATSTLGLYLEQAVESIGTFTPSHKIKVKINGTEYWIQLDAV